MNNQLKLEGAGLFLLFTYVYYYLEFSWSWFFILFLVPDISFVFYLFNTKVGAVAYNILHHQGIFGALLFIGLFLEQDPIIYISLIFLAHSNFDRMMGYGLKFNDSFQHTHLGYIGKQKK